MKPTCPRCTEPTIWRRFTDPAGDTHRVCACSSCDWDDSQIGDPADELITLPAWMVSALLDAAVEPPSGTHQFEVADVLELRQAKRRATKALAGEVSGG